MARVWNALHEQAGVGFFQRATLSWVTPLILKGKLGPLTDDAADYLVPASGDASLLAAQFEAKYAEVKVGITIEVPVMRLRCHMKLSLA